MSKYRARVDCHLEPAAGDSNNLSSRANGEFFVNLIQHISSSMGDLGIEMLAWNYGAGGSGWKFWDEDGHTGRNAFACFRFHSASLGKFDCLIYENTGSNNAHTGSVYIDDQSTSNDGSSGWAQVGIAFACHPSGTVTDTYPNTGGPWNGGYGENTWIETTGPVWKLSSAQKGAFFPRTNGRRGVMSSSRAALAGIAGDEMYQSKAHFIVSEDSLTIFVDDNLNGNQRMTHFGPYLPRSGTNPDSPYVMCRSGNDGFYETWGNFWGNAIGSTSRVQNAPQGGIADPDLTKGTRSFSWITLGVNSSNGYNSFINSGSFEKFPVWVTPNEGGERGIVGTIKHLNCGVGMVNLSVSTLSSSAAFGRSTLGEAKVLVPWDGDPPQTTANVRTGRTFSIG